MRRLTTVCATTAYQAAPLRFLLGDIRHEQGRIRFPMADAACF